MTVIFFKQFVFLSLSSIGTKQLEELRDLAWLIHNITECVRSDRLKPYNTEAEMVVQAQLHSKTFELLAGMFLPWENHKDCLISGHCGIIG